jgi:lysophospholipase L1-like esterase
MRVPPRAVPAAHRGGTPPTKTAAVAPSTQRLAIRLAPEPGGPELLEVPLTEPAGDAFGRFYDRLQALKEGRAQRVRITFWGDSHIAGEVLVARIRSRLQQELGDAGPGFVYLGQPWRSYRHLKVKLDSSRSWRSERIWSRYSRRRRQPRDDLLGMGGISVYVPARRRATAAIVPRGKGGLAALDLHYLRQPRGGRIELRADGKRLRWLLTVASAKEATFARVELPENTRKVELQTSGGEVRLFGVDLASGQPGVICDTLGLNGAKATAVQDWNEALMARQVARLAPDLVVLAYGSNEVDAETLTREQLAEGFDQLLGRMRRLAPGAACLVVGPPDQARLRKEYGWEVPPQLNAIVEEQRRLARLRGCAFWDQRAAMGGAGSIFSWVGADPPLARSDHVHLYSEGYRRIADGLYTALVEGWARHQSLQAPATAPATAPASAPASAPADPDQ